MSARRGNLRDHAKDWQNLPDGAVVVVDECYSAFPRRMPGAKVPAYVEALATHRHRAFDFLLICQQAKQQVDGFVLGLVEWHEHVRRKMRRQGRDSTVKDTTKIRVPWFI